MKRFLLLTLTACALSACAVNPVTKETDLWLITEKGEISRGTQSYLPLQQAGGGTYTVDPTLTDYVAGVGQKIAAVSDRPLPYEFVVLNSSVPNAWALPGGKIAITRGLLVELDNEAELAAVLGHEVVHAAARHGAKALQRGMISSLALLVGVAVLAQDASSLNYILGAGIIGSHLIQRQYGRDAEREADYYGTKYMHAAGYDSTAVVTLQEKFVALSKGRKTSWLDGLFASHPPSPERVENNREALKDFPPGQERGEDRYAERLQYVKARKEAYTDADQARKLLKKNPADALKTIERALEREPNEPQFYGIKGQILERQGQYHAAVRAYDEALARDETYYEHYLGRGLAYVNLKRTGNARQDFERSLEILPTAVASFALGGLVLDDGDREQAKRLFRAASRSRGDIGRKAREAFIKLDVVDLPGRYVTAKPFVRNGRMVLKVTNTTGVDLRNVRMDIQGTINGTPIRPQVRHLSHLAAMSFRVVETGVAFWKDKVEIDARILQATPPTP